MKFGPNMRQIPAAPAAREADFSAAVTAPTRSPRARPLRNLELETQNETRFDLALRTPSGNCAQIVCGAALRSGGGVPRQRGIRQNCPCCQRILLRRRRWSRNRMSLGRLFRGGTLRTMQIGGLKQSVASIFCRRRADSTPQFRLGAVGTSPMFLKMRDLSS
jgi:hypothetical protein